MVTLPVGGLDADGLVAAVQDAIDAALDVPVPDPGPSDLFFGGDVIVGRNANNRLTLTGNARAGLTALRVTAADGNAARTVLGLANAQNATPGNRTQPYIAGEQKVTAAAGVLSDGADPGPELAQEPLA